MDVVKSVPRLVVELAVELVVTNISIWLSNLCQVPRLLVVELVYFVLVTNLLIPAKTCRPKEPCRRTQPYPLSSRTISKWIDTQRSVIAPLLVLLAHYPSFRQITDYEEVCVLFL